MKRFTAIFVLMLGCVSFLSAQNFKGNFMNEDLKLKIVMNLYNDSIPVPGIDDEHCYGYLQGNINGTWIILKVVSLEKNKAVVRASCDNGSDSQNLELTVVEKGIEVKQLDDANIKMIVGRKYAKMPKPFTVHK